LALLFFCEDLKQTALCLPAPLTPQVQVRYGAGKGTNFMELIARKFESPCHGGKLALFFTSKTEKPDSFNLFKRGYNQFFP
jgi:hypothetical protein